MKAPFSIREDLYVKMGTYNQTKGGSKSEAVAELLAVGLEYASFPKVDHEVRATRRGAKYQVLQYTIPDEIEDSIRAIVSTGYSRTYVANRLIEVGLEAA